MAKHWWETRRFPPQEWELPDDQRSRKPRLAGYGEGGSLLWYINKDGYQRYVGQDRLQAEQARQQAQAAAERAALSGQRPTCWLAPKSRRTTSPHRTPSSMQRSRRRGPSSLPGSRPPSFAKNLKNPMKTDVRGRMRSQCLLFLAVALALAAAVSPSAANNDHYGALRRLIRETPLVLQNFSDENGGSGTFTWTGAFEVVVPAKLGWSEMLVVSRLKIDGLATNASATQYDVNYIVDGPGRALDLGLSERFGYPSVVFKCRSAGCIQRSIVTSQKNTPGNEDWVQTDRRSDTVDEFVFPFRNAGAADEAQRLILDYLNDASPGR